MAALPLSLKILFQPASAGFWREGALSMLGYFPHGYFIPVDPKVVPA
jgi:hypothetical protein